MDSLKYRSEIEDGLRRTENMLERAKTANNLRDQISRAYYSCYHVIISAIFLKEKFDRDPVTGSPHWNARERYKVLYSRKGFQIVRIKNFVEVMKLWKELRESADYEIFTDDFESFKISITENELNRMYDFVKKHIVYIKAQLGVQDL